MAHYFIYSLKGQPLIVRITVYCFEHKFLWETVWYSIRTHLRINGYGNVIVNLILSGSGFVVLSDSISGNAQKLGGWLGAGYCYLISSSYRFGYFHKVSATAVKCKNVARDREVF